MLNPSLSPATPITPSAPVSASPRAREFHAGRFWLSWIAATLLGLPFGIALAISLANDPRTHLGTFPLLTMISVLPSCIPQWWVLRPYVRHPWLWSVSTVIGTLGALGVYLALFSVTTGTNDYLSRMLTSIIFSGLALPVIGLVQMSALIVHASKLMLRVLLWPLVSTFIAVISIAGFFLGSLLGSWLADMLKVQTYSFLGTVLWFGSGLVLAGAVIAVCTGLYITTVVQDADR